MTDKQLIMSQQPFFLCLTLKQSNIMLFALTITFIFMYIIATFNNSDYTLHSYNYRNMIKCSNNQSNATAAKLSSLNNTHVTGNINKKIDRNRILDRNQSGLTWTSSANNSNEFEQIILVWTNLYLDPTWERTMERVLPCGALITRAREYLAQASVVIFHWRDVNVKDLPKYKVKGQRWIWFLVESPHHTWNYANLVAFQNKFDCWGSYRHDSDFMFSYGWLDQSNSTEPVKQISLLKKTKQVAWLVSNCRTPSGRERYVKNLQQYISVDIYGRCGHLKCSDYSNCWNMIESKYKFYLSFENSICKDYYTEKIYNALSYNVIPIVYGGANYSQIFPPKSLINALDFESPKELAQFLTNLANNETEYNSYFTWKQNFKSVVRKSFYFNETFCQILSSVENNVTCQGSKNSLIDWWYGQANCKTWNPQFGLIDSKDRDFIP